MIDVLVQLLTQFKSLPYLIADFCVMILNAFIAAIAALANAILNLLPAFPDPPAPPSSGVMGWLTWIAPIGTLVAAFALMVTCWLTFLLIRIPLKWVKAL